jgi:hypothetical protein
MTQFRRSYAVLGVGVAAAALALSTGLQAQAAATSGWRIVFSQHFGGKENPSWYFGVAAAGPSAAWAVGTAQKGQAQVPIAAHWDGRKWRETTVPAGLTNGLEAVSADSSTDAWAVSLLGGYALHWTGGRWWVARKWPEHALATEMTGVTAFSPTDVWVFGGSGANPGVGTWHLHGSTWTRVGGFGGNIAFASALSPANMWAIGGIEVGEDSIMHYLGGHWRHIVAPALKNLQYHGILAGPDGQVWATANPDSDSFRALLVQLSGRRWSAVTLPWRLDPGSLTSDGHGGVWLTAFGPAGQPYLIHRSASGRWTRLRTPFFSTVFNLTPNGNAASLWGAGTAGGQASAASSAAVWAYGRVG